MKEGLGFYLLDGPRYVDLWSADIGVQEAVVCHVGWTRWAYYCLLYTTESIKYGIECNKHCQMERGGETLLAVFERSIGHAAQTCGRRQFEGKQTVSSAEFYDGEIS